MWIAFFRRPFVASVHGDARSLHMSQFWDPGAFFGFHCQVVRLFRSLPVFRRNVSGRLIFGFLRRYALLERQPLVPHNK